ncbi:TonB-dependent siderophore receptor [Pseudomonas sp. UL073]|uniref:TonB-dependent siderophore receptor n=1 Tax=Zestomonas insulae TaxID=2809017 RepID=A0ABS2IL84_9GAMM|nr:TonB-dependent siderophore receptor [Pseudomonas insulae]MBM7062643.1 TonB-dependent siderophore receptor [Pseudomonas insulae]
MPQSTPLPRTRLTVAVRHALFAGLLAAGALPLLPLAQAQPAASQQARSYAIPAGNLDQVLNRFASEAGILLSVDAQLTAGKRSPGLNGSYAVDEGLARLLSGTGLRALNAGGNYVLEAATGDGTVELGATSIQGQAYSSASPDDGYVAKRASVGSKTDAPLIETPTSVSVVTREQIEAQQPKTVAQALRYTPGVNAELAGPQFVTDQLMIRGFQMGTGRMLRDGTRTFLPDFLGWDAPEPYGLERIEVLRGASSVLYGVSDPGGQINLVSKRPTAEPLHQVQLQAGNLDYRQGAFDLSDALDEEGVWSYRLTGLLREADAQAEHITNRRQYFAPAISFRPSENTELTLLAEYQKQTGNFANPLPAAGTVFGTAQGRLDRDTYVGNTNYDHMTNEKTSLGYVFEHRFDEVWTLRQNLRYSYYRQDSAELAIFGPIAPPLYSRYLQEREGDGRLFTVDTQAQADFATGDVQHTLLGGFDYNNGKFDQTQDLSFVGEAFDIFAPVHDESLTFFPVPAFSSDYTQKLSQTGVYLQDQLKLDSWVFVLGGRYDWTSDQRDDRAPQTQKDERFTARAGVVYLFDNGLAPYASYSESFLPTIGNTLDGSQLEPTIGKQYEIGVKYEPTGYNALYTLAAFDLTRENLTEFLPLGVVRQDAEVRSKGIELEAKAEIAQGLNLIGSYTWNDVEVTESDTGTEGNTPFRVPEHMASLWADYTVQGGALSGLRLGAGTRYVGSSYGDSANSFKVDSYSVVDALLSYPLDQLDASLAGVELSLNAVNLFDDDYVAGCFNDVGCQYGQPRTVYATLDYSW